MQEKDEKMNEIKAQIVDDLENFTIASNVLKIKSSKLLNIKKLLDRSITLFKSALERIHNIRALSCFDIVEELTKKKLMSESCKHKLMFAIVLACEIRLKWYMKCRRQNNIIEIRSLYGIVL